MYVHADAYMRMARYGLTTPAVAWPTRNTSSCQPPPRVSLAQGPRASATPAVPDTSAPASQPLTSSRKPVTAAAPPSTTCAGRSCADLASPPRPGDGGDGGCGCGRGARSSSRRPSATALPRPVGWALRQACRAGSSAARVAAAGEAGGAVAEGSGAPAQRAAARHSRSSAAVSLPRMDTAEARRRSITSRQQPPKPQPLASLPAEVEPRAAPPRTPRCPSGPACPTCPAPPLARTPPRTPPAPPALRRPARRTARTVAHGPRRPPARDMEGVA
jgi:hypothetical protein